MSASRCAIAAVLACASIGQAGADCTGLRIEQAWIPQAPPVAAVLGGYASLFNDGGTALHIDAVDGADFGGVEMHQMSMEGGMMQMRPLPGLDLPPRGSLVLAEGGKHLMLMNPKHPFKAGDTTALRFHCGQQSTVANFTVRAPAP